MSTGVEQRLSDMLRNRADRVTPAPDPWTSFTTTERHGVRVRRVRQAALGVAAAVVAAGLTAAAVNGLIPLPSSDGDGTQPAAKRMSLLWNEPPRGSLAGDSAWITGMREAVVNVSALEDETRVVLGGAGGVRILYAGDVAGHRVALAALTVRDSEGDHPRFEWYTGEDAAAPAAMSIGNTEADALQDVTVTGNGDMRKTGYLVAVAPRGATVEVSFGATYRADGRLDRRWRTVGSDGTAVVEVPAFQENPAIAVRATLDGRVLAGSGPAMQGTYSEQRAGEDWELAEERDRRSTNREITSAALAAEADAGLGRGPVDTELAAGYIASAFDMAHLSTKGTRVTIRTGSVAGNPGAVVILTPEGGGTVVLGENEGTGHWNLRLLAPAAGALDRPYAWRFLVYDDTRDSELLVGSEQVAVSAPPTTHRAEIVVDGSTRPVTLDARGFGTATVPLSAEATVRAYAADGTLLGESPVYDASADDGDLPGATRTSRLVD
ncbi:MAG: hypothetical protein GXX79_01785 [Actinomycetales bacterium]|nr:hypothetical protein [Actinomycetales bacterium]